MSEQRRILKYDSFLSGKNALLCYGVKLNINGCEGCVHGQQSSVHSVAGQERLFVCSCTIALLFTGIYFLCIATKRTFYSRSKKEKRMVSFHLNLH